MSIRLWSEDVRRILPGVLVLLTSSASACGERPGAPFGEAISDLVLVGGRVIDPESGSDGVASVGIRDGVITAVGGQPEGLDSIDVTGLIVAPGFVDLHAHGQDPENYGTYARDGVTTALELESGTADVDAWYADRAGGQRVNYGVGVGHSLARMRVMEDPGPTLPTGPAAHREAEPREIETIREIVTRGLAAGAVSVGLQVQNTPGASRWEVLEMFKAAAEYKTPVHVHLRHMGSRGPANAIAALLEVVAAATITGAPLHVLHVHSMGLDATDELLEIIADARAAGIDVTTEAYPYTAGMTGIESAVFDPGWQDVLGIGYGDLEWPESGERLTRETYARYRQQGGSVILHFVPEPMMELAIRNPLTAIISDGRLSAGKGHPRTAGAFARVLGRFVRETGDLTWAEAVRKMTLLPVQRLEARVPEMRRKGRIQTGADADITVFDPETVMDQSTYEDPARAPLGIPHVLVGGIPVVLDGELQEAVVPGQPVRGPLRQ